MPFFFFLIFRNTLISGVLFSRQSSDPCGGKKTRDLRMKTVRTPSSASSDALAHPQKRRDSRAGAIGFESFPSSFLGFAAHPREADQAGCFLHPTKTRSKKASPFKVRG